MLVVSGLLAVVKAVLVYYFNFPNTFSSIKATLVFYSFGVVIIDLVVLLLARDMLDSACRWQSTLCR